MWNNKKKASLGGLTAMALAMGTTSALALEIQVGETTVGLSATQSRIGFRTSTPVEGSTLYTVIEGDF